MRKLACSFCAVLFCFVFSAGFLYAGELPEPLFDTSEPVKKEITREYVYYFEVMEYIPPVKVELVSNRSDARMDSPENALISGISAMYAKDYEWWLNTWDTDSREMMRERNKVKGWSPDFWRKGWEGFLKDREAILTHRVDTGDYVIIGYSLVSEEKDRKTYESYLVFKKQGEEWFSTQDLIEDPVSQGWRTPEKEIPRQRGKRNPRDLKRLKEILLK